jgi:hypothetical protein
VRSATLRSAECETKNALNGNDNERAQRRSNACSIYRNAPSEVENLFAVVPPFRDGQQAANGPRVQTPARENEINVNFLYSFCLLSCVAAEALTPKLFKYDAI